MVLLPYTAAGFRLSAAMPARVNPSASRNRLAAPVIFVANILWLVAAFSSCTPAEAYYRCPDGSDGLTKELYEAGDPSKYADVTCIPSKEFSGYKGDITLDRGFKRLLSIEYAAFSLVKGTITFTGSFPKLKVIGSHAFRMSNSRAYSKVEIVDAPLTLIDGSAFYYFKGSLTITGNFPGLVVGSRAFFYAGDATATVSVCSAKTVESDAFNGYKGSRDACNPTTRTTTTALTTTISSTSTSAKPTTGGVTTTVTTTVAPTISTTVGAPPASKRNAGKAKAWVVALILVLIVLVGAIIFFVVWRRKKQATDDDTHHAYADGTTLVNENEVYDIDDSARTRTPPSAPALADTTEA